MFKKLCCVHVMRYCNPFKPNVYRGIYSLCRPAAYNSFNSIPIYYTILYYASKHILLYIFIMHLLYVLYILALACICVCLYTYSTELACRKGIPGLHVQHSNIMGRRRLWNISFPTLHIYKLNIPLYLYYLNFHHCVVHHIVFNFCYSSHDHPYCMHFYKYNPSLA